MAIKSKNQKVLNDFIKYCQENPNQRFWQALKNWCGYNFIFVSNHNPLKNPLIQEELIDTYYIEGK
jgi:hypothetical protein